MMSTKGRHRMTLRESLRRRVTAHRAAVMVARSRQLIKVREARLARQMSVIRATMR